MRDWERGHSHAREVWGTRTYYESALFEALTLGVFQAGLSWSVVFGKRDGFRSAFHGFDVAKVAAMTEHDVDRLVQDPSDRPDPHRKMRSLRLRCSIVSIAAIRSEISSAPIRFSGGLSSVTVASAPSRWKRTLLMRHGQAAAGAGHRTFV